MRLAVDVAAENARSPLSRDDIASAARAVLRYERVRDALLSITLVDRRTISRLNADHLGHRGDTDVISFGFARATPTDPVIGDIYICPDVARENAKLNHARVRDEIARLVVHGVLHVLGYDHPETPTRDRSKMWRRQERLLRRLGYGVRP
ncbi:MAG TPA: rRNA maturation RNase YbeY [Gemmatimonadaceae bacterium]